MFAHVVKGKDNRYRWGISGQLEEPFHFEAFCCKVQGWEDRDECALDAMRFLQLALIHI